MKPLQLSAAQLAALGRLPNVTAVEPRSLFATRVWVGERRERAIVIGVPDYARQRADVVTIDSGAAPAAGAVLTDQNNAKAKGFGAAPAPTRAIDRRRRQRPLAAISGVGRNLTGGQDDPSNDWITFYATPQTVAALSGAPGYTSLALAPARQQPAGGRAHRRRRPRSAARDDGVHRLRRPAGRSTSPAATRARPTSRAWPSILDVDHAAGAAVGAGAGVEHDDDADRRADGRDRRDEGDRRAPARHPAHLPAHRAAARRARGGCSAPRSGSLLANALVGVLRVGVLLRRRRLRRRRSRSSSPASCVGLVGPPLAALPAIRRASRLPLNEALQASGLGGRRPGAPGRRAAARALPAAQRADRVARARPAQAAQPRHGAAGLARRRDAAGAAVARRRRGQDQAAAGSTTTTSTSGSRPWRASRSAPTPAA